MSEYESFDPLEEERNMERKEMKLLAQRLLRTAFEGVLEGENLERRLSMIEETRFFSPEEFASRVEEHPEEADADGIMHMEVVGREVRRFAIVKEGTRAETLHTLLHEGTHLMAPESHVVTDYMREADDQVHSVYLGALRYDRVIKTGEVDPLSVRFDRVQARHLFWESITDWHADELLRDELSETERDEIATGGYIERHYIEHLINTVLERGAFIEAIRKAYATGSEDPFYWEMQRISGRKDDAFYEELLNVLSMPLNDDTWEQRLDAWMATVKKYLSTKL